MKSAITTALFLALGLANAASALSIDDLKGSWVVDQDALLANMAKSPEFASIPADQRSMITGLLKAKLGALRWDFTKDGSTVTDPDGKVTPISSTGFTSTGPHQATVAGTDSKHPEALVKLELKNDRLIVSQAKATGAKTTPGLEELTLTRLKVPAKP